RDTRPTTSWPPRSRRRNGAAAPPWWRAATATPYSFAPPPPPPCLPCAPAQEDRRGAPAVVASGDRDTFQLASASTTIVHPVRAGEMARIGPAQVRERYGVEPSQAPDLSALLCGPHKRASRARRREGADRPGEGARALRRRAEPGAGLHRAARRSVGQAA